MPRNLMRAAFAKGFVFYLVVVLSILNHVVAAEEPFVSPLKNHQKGDWVEFTGTGPKDPLSGRAATMMLRYTLKERSDSIATLTVASGRLSEKSNKWIVMQERDIQVPIDKPLDLAGMALTSEGKVKVTREKVTPDQKLTVGNTEYRGAIREYVMEVDLFGALASQPNGTPGGGPKKSGKPLEIKMAYFVSSEAPVLGIAAITVTSLSTVKYELSDGTGLVKAAKQPTQPQSDSNSNLSLGRVGDWIEYSGTSKDGRRFVLRHTIQAAEKDAVRVEAKLTADSAVLDTWQFAFPTKNPLDLLPHLSEMELAESQPKVAKENHRGYISRPILDGKKIEVDRTTYDLKLDFNGKKHSLFFTVGYHREIPITGLASIELNGGNPKNQLTLELLLSEHSGNVSITNPLRPPATKKRTI